MAGARNIGLVASRGEYLSFLDDDDTRLPDSLDAQIEALERNPQAGLIYGRAIWGDQEGTPGNLGRIHQSARTGMSFGNS